MSITLNAGSGGATLKTTSDGTAEHQHVVLETYSAGVPTAVSSSNALSVSDATVNVAIGAKDGALPASGISVFGNDAGTARVPSVQTDAGVVKWLQVIRDAAGNARGANVDASSQLLVNNSGNTQPVSAASLPLPSGAATAAKQPALGTAGTASSDVITVQGIASMTALKTDGSATTQPVSAASLPLPTGASTAAKQPALGTAGTASADVITVQGIASMTAIKTDGSAVTQPVSLAAATTGGATPYASNGTCSKTQVKGSAGTIYHISCVNVSSAVVYLQLFNVASASVTLGTTTPDLQWAVPTQAAGTSGAGFVIDSARGFAFGTAITFAITTTRSGATATTDNNALLNIGYA